MRGRDEGMGVVGRDLCRCIVLISQVVVLDLCWKILKAV